MSYQPYLTLKDIYKKRDKSQIFLVALTAISPAVIYVAARIIWDLAKYHRLLLVTGKVFIAAAVIQAAVLIYLGYWTWQVLRREK